MLEDKIMIDLETLGTKAGCGIIAIGACTFDGQHQFYQKIAREESERVGLLTDPDTMRWWAKQSSAARNESFSGTASVIEVLGAFSDWMRATKQKTKVSSQTVWGNGADFDLPILKGAYDAVDMKIPWGPWSGRCYRTLKNLKPNLKADEFQGEKHTALADAMHQALHARLLFAALKLL